jgi:hypothetical protein
VVGLVCLSGAAGALASPFAPVAGALTTAPGSPDSTGATPGSVAFSPGGGFLAIANTTADTVSMFAVAVSGALTPIGSAVSTGSAPQSLTFSPRGGLLVVAETGSNSVSVYSVSAVGTLTLVGSPFTTGANPSLVAFSPSGGPFAMIHYTWTAAASVAPATTTAPRAKRCPSATGRLRGTRLGLLTLGMTRAQAIGKYARSSTRGTRFEDFFCVTPIGVRAGYASKLLLKTLTRHQRAGVRRRVVLVLTANRFYALRGVRPGARLRVAAKALHTGAGMRVGVNDWYLAPNGPSTAVIEVRRGIVDDIGIATKMLTHGRRAQLRFIKSFS